MSPVNVGLVAFGMSGRIFHAPFLDHHPGFGLRTVVERHHEHSKAVYPDVTVVRSLKALLDDDSIDLVVITTPNSLHYEQTKRALESGKHVVVEKPFTITSREADDLIDLARQRDRMLAVYHNRRWDGDFLTVRRILNGRQLGRLVEFESHFDRFRNYLKPDSWREQGEPGNGMLYDLGSHLIDQALVLFGPPDQLTADIRTQREGGQIDDNFELILHYDDLKVTLKSCMLVREPGVRFILHGTKGSYVKYGLDPQEEALDRGRTPDEPGWGEEPEEHWGTLNTEFDGLHFIGRVETVPGQYQGFYENIYQVLTDDGDLMVKPHQARNVIRMIELARESNEDGRTIEVDLS